VIARKGPMWKMHGEAKVDGALAARADVTATIPDGVEPHGEGDGE
jgi:3-hydroxymyristoyl/3-hydroxydecanoyl-(acyl carrier protein) dehydratase